LKEALQYWYQKTKSKVTYEYVVWKGINDDKASIDALVKFCKYVPCKVNLIEYNPIDDGEFQQASDEAAISRVYGGIHYKPACEVGKKQGVAVGMYILSRISTRKKSL